MAKAIRTVVWRILVFYIGSVFVIAAVLPATSEALASPFAGVLDAARIPGAGTAITLVAVVALLSALNANLYGASRMVYSLSERGEAPAFLSRLSGAKVPMVAVGVSVAFGFIATVLELLFPERILPALFQLVGSTCLVVWGTALVSQLILRRRADRDGTPLPLRMKGFPGTDGVRPGAPWPDLRRGTERREQPDPADQHRPADRRHRRSMLGGGQVHRLPRGRPRRFRNGLARRPN